MAIPPHLLLDNSYYFITSRSNKSYSFFSELNYKKMLLGTIKESVKEFEFRLVAWVILNNHYHIILRVIKSNMLPKFMQKVHGRSSRRLKNIYNMKGRLISLPSGGGNNWKVWNNYWDRIIRDREDMNIHLNYILYNPVKHNYVDNPKDYQMVYIKLSEIQFN